MKAIVQRVSKSSVSVSGSVCGRTEKGFMILLGVAENDCEKDAEILAAKISKLRIFTDENGKMNLSLADIGGGALVVSNFTLCADVSHGNRPSFTPAAPPDAAQRLYEYFVKLMRESGVHTETGIFGADMSLEISNDGPVTIIFDSKIFIK